MPWSIVVARQRPLDALGSPGGARGVQHHLAGRLLVEAVGRHGRYGVRVGLEARIRVADQQRQRHVRCVAQRLGRHVGLGGAGHQRPAAGVVEDVCHLLRGQVAVDGRDVEAGPQRRPHDLQELGVVLAEDRHVVARAEAVVAPQPGQLVGPFVELPVGDDLPAGPHDQSGLVWCAGCVDSWIHGSPRGGGRCQSSVGRKTGRRRPSESSMDQSTATRWSQRSEPGSAPTMLVVIRMPSSRSTRPTT